MMVDWCIPNVCLFIVMIAILGVFIATLTIDIVVLTQKRNDDKKRKQEQENEKTEILKKMSMFLDEFEKTQKKPKGKKK